MKIRRVIYMKFLYTGMLVVWLMFGSTLSAKNCEMWYEDNNMGKIGYIAPDAIDKFNDPASWKKSLNSMDVFMIRLNALYPQQNHITPYFIKHKLYRTLKKHNIRFALDVIGGTLTNLNSKKKKQYIQELDMIDRLYRMGVEVDYIYFQSALSKKHAFGTKLKYGYDYPMKQRIDDIVTYAKTIHAKYPKIKFGIIDVLPILGLPYKKPYRDLMDAMKQNGIRLDGIILDGPYQLIKRHWRGLTWKKILDVEKYVKHDLGIQFGKIFTDKQGGKRSDKMFYHRLVEMAKQYKSSGGKADICMLMSWYPHPRYTIPETLPYTMTYDFLKLTEILK